MLHSIPTHIVCGTLGAGKTTLIKQWLQQKPAHERWALLINEFGMVGLDAALIGQWDGVSISEIPGGCLCCVNGVPFQVGLTRLLRTSKPDRLIIEPSGLGHPQALIDQLQREPWQQVLQVQPATYVLDAQRWLATGQITDIPTPCNAVWITKSATLSAQQRRQLIDLLSPIPCLWSDQQSYPQPTFTTTSSTTASSTEQPSTTVTPPNNALWINKQKPLVFNALHPEGSTSGWRWHGATTFALADLTQVLSQLPWLRCKAVMHTEQGWISFNATEPSMLYPQPCAVQTESRLELIYSHAIDVNKITEQLNACQLGDSAPTQSHSPRG